MHIILIVMAFLLSACSNLPTTIRDAPARDFQIAEVRADTASFSGTDVRWGGIIATVDNQENFSAIQVLSYPLALYGRPLTHLQDTGRFYFQTADFLDPTVYVKGAAITISGTLNGEIAKKVGQKTLTLPVVDSQELHLWQYPRRQDYGYRDYWVSNHRSYGYYPFGYSRRGYRRYNGYRACY